MKLINKKFVGKRKVRDLTVQDNHNFIVSDIIVHNCHTYKIADYIKNNIDKKLSKRLLIHTTENRDEILKKHIQSKQPTILLTPSMSEGVDLKDDLSRFQIICKLPFPFLGDKRILLKNKLQPWWYSFQTVKMIIQSLGRSIRTPKDFAISYILDSDWEFFYNRNKHLFPEWIQKTIHH